MTQILPVDVLQLPRRIDCLAQGHSHFVPDEGTFFVDELPAYLPCGEGEHLYLDVRKKNLNTQDVVKALSRALEVPQRDVGYAGLKDRHATTRQWISVRGADPAQAEALKLEGIEILSVEHHRNKLRVGHLTGNRFRIALPWPGEAQAALYTQALEELMTKGLPNFFGRQRFGREGTNAEAGRRILLEEERPRARWKVRFFLSSYQSALFNDLLAHRLQQGLLDTVLAGDLLKKHESGGQFVCEEPEVDQLRADSMELSPTACLPGYKVPLAQGTPGEWEQAILEREGISPQTFRPHGKIVQGTRRLLRVPLSEASWTREGGHCWLTFVLPPGSYASIVLHELGVRFG